MTTRTIPHKPSDQTRFRRKFRLAAKRALASSLMLAPCLAGAAGIGEAVLHSKLGEPLRARIELMAEKSDHIDGSCLSLLKPEADEDSGSFLAQARVSLVAEAGKLYAEVRTTEAFNEPFGLLRLQVKCASSSAGGISKTLAILPDLPDSNEPSQRIAIVEPEAPEDIAQVRPDPALAPKNAARPAPQVNPPALPATPAPAAGGNTNAAAASQTAPTVGVAKTAKPVAPAATTVTPRKRRALAGREKAFYKPSFQLKLSGSLLDESLAELSGGKKQQRLLEQKQDEEADNQTARFLTLLHQVKLLQEELESVKQELARIKGAPETGSASAENTLKIAELTDMASAPVAEREIVPQPAEKPLAAKEQTPTKFIGATEIAYLAAAIFLTAMGILLGMRLFGRFKSKRHEGDLYQTHIPYSAAPAAAHVPEHIPSQKLADTIPPGALHAPAIAQPPSAPGHAYVREAPPETAEDDLLLEEAELYNIHGHPDKASVILREILDQYPKKFEAWLLLLSIHSVAGRKPEFDQVMLEMQKHDPDEATLVAAQSLQKSLEHSISFDGDKTLPKAAPARKIEPLDLDLEFELPSTGDAVTELDFEMPEEISPVADINFELPDTVDTIDFHQPSPEENKLELTAKLNAYLNSNKPD